MKKYNLLYIHTHDTGRLIQPYDPAVPTPNLMDLAREGTVFRNAHCVCPTCSPSRSGLLTGQYPHENGMLGLAHRGFALNDYSKHLANFLKRNGYETALFGIQHEAAHESLIGYDRTFVATDRFGPGRPTWDDRNADQALDFIRGDHEKPFFLSCGLIRTHKPYPETEIDPDYVRVPACLPDTDPVRRDYAGFLTSAKQADRVIGRVLDALKEAGLYENTIVLYTTDHGVALPHMKCTLYDSGTGVAMILSVPGRRRPRVLDGLVSQLDVYPTLCDLLGLEKPQWLRGKSMMPLLNGEAEQINDVIFSEINYHAARDPQRMVRTRRYKYIKYYRPRQTHPYVMCNIDAGEAKEFLAEQGLGDYEMDNEQLFDLYMDPAEGRNLVDDPAYAQVGEQMRQLLREHMAKTNDTIETDGLPTVPGMKVNKMTCYDPAIKDYE